MSVRNGIALLLALFALTFLIACGGSSSPKVVPPPSGGFSKSSLSGTYVFSGSGTDLVNGSFFAVAGTVVANGSGGLTGGSFDLVDSFLGVSTGNSVSGGTYTITSDGRGTATLPGNLGIGIDFVLTSSSHGLITRFDNSGTGSGTLDLQGTQTVPSGSYSFSFGGVDSSGNPLATVGSFGLTGQTISGFQDFNDHYTISETGLTNLPLSGTVVAGPVVGPAGTQLTTSSTFGTLSFDVFEIDSTHLKFIETDGLEFLAGDAFTQQTSIPSGQLVFTMAGFDLSRSFLAAGGYLTSDGSSLITTGVEDVNDGGSTGQALGVTGNFASTGGGRFTLTLNGIFNGSSSTGNYSFAAYPSSGGIQLLEIDGSGITSGAAYAQSSTSLSTPQGYGLNLTGVDLASGSEVDDIAEFTAQSGTLKGIVDINDGGPVFDQSLGNSTYTLDSPATGRGEISTAQFGLIFYVVDSSTSIFIQSDNTGQVALGTFQLQNTPGSAAAAQAHFLTVRPVVRSHAFRHK